MSLTKDILFKHKPQFTKPVLSFTTNVFSTTHNVIVEFRSYVLDSKHNFSNTTHSNNGALEFTTNTSSKHFSLLTRNSVLCNKHSLHFLIRFQSALEFAKDIKKVVYHRNKHNCYLLRMNVDTYQKQSIITNKQ